MVFIEKGGDQAFASFSLATVEAVVAAAEAAR